MGERRKKRKEERKTRKTTEKARGKGKITMSHKVGKTMSIAEGVNYAASKGVNVKVPKSKRDIEAINRNIIPDRDSKKTFERKGEKMIEVKRGLPEDVKKSDRTVKASQDENRQRAEVYDQNKELANFDQLQTDQARFDQVRLDQDIADKQAIEDYENRTAGERLKFGFGNLVGLHKEDPAVTASKGKAEQFIDKTLRAEFKIASWLPLGTGATTLGVKGAKAAGKIAVSKAAAKITAKQIGTKVPYSFYTSTADIAKYGKNLIKVSGNQAKYLRNTIKAGKYITGAAALGFGVDSIATWAAVDNIASSIPFQLNDITKGVREGLIDPQTALELMDQAEQTLALSTEFVDTSTRFNPALMHAKKRYNLAVATSTRSFEIKRLMLENLISLQGGAEQ